jgi:hypothetical protein
MVKVLSRLAERYYPRRWIYVGIALTIFSIVFGGIFSGFSNEMKALFVLTGPVIGIFWGLACMCFWFHPNFGKMYTGRIVRHLPDGIQPLYRSLGATFLVLWVGVLTIAWPVTVILY